MSGVLAGLGLFFVALVVGLGLGAVIGRSPLGRRLRRWCA